MSIYECRIRFKDKTFVVTAEDPGEAKDKAYKRLLDELVKDPIDLIDDITGIIKCK